MTERPARMACGLALLAGLAQSAPATAQPRYAVPPSPPQPAAPAQASDAVTPSLAQRELAAQADYLLVLYELYGLAWTSSVSGQSAEEIARLAATYVTNGAQATAVPEGGAGAAYFRNGSEVFAAPTASWIQTTNPDLGAGSFEQPLEATTAPDAGAAPDAGTGPEPTLEASPGAGGSADASEESAGPAAEEAPSAPSGNSAPASETPPQTDASVAPMSGAALPNGSASAAIGLPPAQGIRVALPVPGPIAGLGPTAVAARIRYVPVVLAVGGGVFVGAVCALVGARMRSRRLRRH